MRTWFAVFLTASAAVGFSTFLALTTDRQPFDLPFTHFVQRLELQQLGTFSDLIFWMGLRGFAGALLIGLGAFLWLRGRRLETLLLIAIALLDLWNVALRDIIDRPRPTADLVGVVIGYGGIQGASFPSGHAMHVILFYGFLIYLIGRLPRPGFLRLGVQAALGLYILIAGLWLVHAGRHWASDVIGGYAYGLFYLMLLIAAYHYGIAWRASRAELWTSSERAGITDRLARVLLGKPA
ncbi:MAG: phosphatase PAP2 family protein [Chloroflexi bacterium]|nr:phosphatase PAP2 family protein [Chloroflexota bacterium]